MINLIKFFISNEILFVLPDKYLLKNKLDTLIKNFWEEFNRQELLMIIDKTEIFKRLNSFERCFNIEDMLLFKNNIVMKSVTRTLRNNLERIYRNWQIG